MKNTILALKGTAKSGKSTTIRKVYEMLKSEYDGEMSIIVEHAGDVDIKVILVVKGVKIGIESQGDPGGKARKKSKGICRRRMRNNYLHYKD